MTTPLILHHAVAETRQTAGAGLRGLRRYIHEALLRLFDELRHPLGSRRDLETGIGIWDDTESQDRWECDRQLCTSLRLQRCYPEMGSTCWRTALALATFCGQRLHGKLKGQSGEENTTVTRRRRN